MSILIYVEISRRELNSKLLLAVVAASKGHQVVVSEKNTIVRGISANWFPGSIFHTKSVTPDPEKMKEHDRIIDKKLSVTSQDEEAGVATHGFESFALKRFSLASVRQVGALFCWGPEDHNFLSKKYPTEADRIYLVGSPRADLWSPKFANFAGSPRRFGLTDYLLIPSNFGILQTSVSEFVNSEMDAGYYTRDPKMLDNRFQYFSDNFRMLSNFVEAIKFLSRRIVGLQIVLRPHPKEDMSLWEKFLQDVPNVLVAREGASIDWVHHAIGIVQNSSTTALEARIARKPVISFVPFERGYQYGSLANELGLKVTSLDGLEKAVQGLLSAADSTRGQSQSKDAHLLERKILIRDEELAAERIVDIWESALGQNDIRRFPWVRFWCLAKLYSAKDFLRNFVSLPGWKLSYEKFPPQDFEEVRKAVRQIENSLGLSRSVKVRRMHSRCFVISPDKVKKSLRKSIHPPRAFGGRKNAFNA